MSPETYPQFLERLTRFLADVASADPWFERREPKLPFSRDEAREAALAAHGFVCRSRLIEEINDSYTRVHEVSDKLHGETVPYLLMRETSSEPGGYEFSIHDDLIRTLTASPFEASIRRVAELTPPEEKTVSGWRLVDGEVHPVPMPAAGADAAAPWLCHDGHRYGPTQASLEPGRFAAIYHGRIDRRVAYLLRNGAETDVYWRIESPLRDRGHEVDSPSALAALMRELEAKGFNEALVGGVLIGSVKRKLESAVYRAGLIPTWAVVGSGRKRRLLLIHRVGEHNERPLAVLHAGEDTPRALAEETLWRELDEHGPLVPLGGSELLRPDAGPAQASSPPLVAESLTDTSTRLAAETLEPARYWEREPAWLDEGSDGALVVDRAKTGREAYYAVRFNGHG